MSSENKPTAAFALSLTGGLLILIGSSFTFAMWGMFGQPIGMMGGGMMGMIGGGWMWFPIFLPILGLVFGILILVGAVMLNSKPDQAQTWGTLILVLSALSLITAGGGFIIGAILGIIGGILAITWKA
ncbi:MAG: DUF6114 domain-containing protein [Aigarchaeota archaeon]|nr:DUF6114 domain-containing protein [Candidatus Pelearchaeum maunauluense]